MFGLDLGLIAGGLGAVIAAVLGIYAKTQSIKADKAEQERNEAEAEAMHEKQRADVAIEMSKINKDYAEKQSNVKSEAERKVINGDGSNLVDDSMWND